ncbi:hypothetical protein SMU9_08677 [Streptococcus mutans 1ID3]|nr:hypothetical protein SMU9_08677 [Streptococcus mutans 1ID3]
MSLKKLQHLLLDSLPFMLLIPIIFPFKYMNLIVFIVMLIQSFISIMIMAKLKHSGN